MTGKTLTVNCPTCKAVVEWNDASPFRPFCSKRCQQIDFGDWVMEKHSIPGEPVFDMEDEDQGKSSH